MPNINDDADEKQYLMTSTADIKLVSDYTHFDFEKVLELDCYTYRVLLKDAYIDMMKQTDEGRDYLEQCWLLTQTKPNKKQLRERFNK